jgi:hypothetical protein
MRNAMKKQLALALIFATASIGLSTLFIGNANAGTVRDHRICEASDPNCRDHRGPVVVIPPIQTPPIIVVGDPKNDPGPGPLPQPEPPHPRPPQDPWHGHGHGPWGNQDDYGISCREGRSIVRQNGYRHVKAMDCSGDVFVYSANTNRGRRAIVSVNMDGEIEDVSF